MYYPEDDENVSLGQGMIDAYKLESEIAIYPRIIVSNNLFNYIKQQKIEAYPFGTTNTLEELIKKDFDGVYFLDLLNKKILRKKDEKIYNQKNKFSIFLGNSDDSDYDNIIKKVRQIIMDNLTENIKIKQKYDWLKSYLKQSNKTINQTMEETQ